MLLNAGPSSITPHWYSCRLGNNSENNLILLIVNYQDALLSLTFALGTMTFNSVVPVMLAGQYSVDL